MTERQARRIAEIVENTLVDIFTSNDNHGIIKALWDASLHPRGLDGKFCAADGMTVAGGSTRGSDTVDSDGKLSPTGANIFQVQGFRSKQKLNNHWGDHGLKQYQDDPDVNSKEDYLNRALALVQSPVGGNIMGHIDGNGNVIRYDTIKEDFVKGNPLKGVYTMFKATIDYYNDMRKGDLEHGGKA